MLHRALKALKVSLRRDGLTGTTAKLPKLFKYVGRRGSELGYYQRYSVSKDAVERRQSADALGDSTSEKREKMCWRLDSALLRQELAKEGVNGRTEEKISGGVIEVCLRAYRKITN